MKLKSLILAALLGVALSAKANFDVTFNTANGTLSNPVFDVNGTTTLDATFFGQIYAGANVGSLVAIGNAVQFGTVGGTVNAGANGFIINNTVTTVSSINSGDTIVYQLRAWTGAATYELASVTPGAKIGNSATTSITVGGPPSLSTAPNTSLHSSFALTAVSVPEPATIALGIFGAAGLLARRRK